MEWIQKPPLGAQIDWAHPLAKGLVGFWLFNEGHGDKVYDLSMHGNHGTLTNMAFPSTAASGWNPSKFGSALSFEGSDDYVDIANNFFSFSQFTIAGWVKYDALTGDDYWQGNDAGNNIIGFYGNRVYTWGWGVGSTQGTTPTTANTWYFVVLVRDAVSTRVYLNTALEFTISSTGLITINDFNIGRGDTGYEFDGLIDEVRIYNRALSAEEIWQLYVDPFSVVESPYEFGTLYPAGLPTYIPYPHLSGLGGGISEAIAGGIAR